MTSRRLLPIVRWLTAIGVLAAIIVLFRHWSHVNPTTVALTMLLFVLVLAARSELRYSIAVSIIATAAYNFYFLPPVGTFTIADPQNWLALFSFLGTSVLGSRLSQRARREADLALLKQDELEVLYLLSRELMQTEGVAQALQKLPSMINTGAAAETVILYLLDGDRLYQAGLRTITGIELPHFRQQALTLSAMQTAPGNEVQVPLRTGVRPRGLLIVRGSTLSPSSLEAVGGLVSITLDHAQAMEAAARTEANKESERLRTLILDSITHELRTPLTSIKGASGALLANMEMTREDRTELLTIVDEESDRLNRLVGQAVEMARIEAREVQMHIEPLDLNEIVEQAREECAWVEAVHPLTVNIPKSLRVDGDRELLGKVVCNLLENAAKYSAPGSPVFVTAEQREGEVAVSVADRGIGIDASEQAFVFDRLYRSRSQAESTPGTGMGLAICRAIIETHHGTLSVISQLGSGSVFTFTLPTVGR